MGSQRVIGLISGTSVDGIDAALVEIEGGLTDLQVNLVTAATYPYPPALREEILAVAGGAPRSLADLAVLDDAIAAQFAEAALRIQANDAPADLIGSHGQTVYHRPPASIDAFTMGYTVQFGRGEAIAHLTRTATVSNFRVADIAAGGHGAPLVPKVDAYLLSHSQFDRCVQNIGGIGNVTHLPARVGELSTWESQISGWDTGPGNMLIDLAVQRLSQGQQTYDANGAWAATGTPCPALVNQWLQQRYFQQPPPKSTGREDFGQDYLQRCCTDAQAYDLNDADLLATLTELTAASIAHSYRTFLPKMPHEVLICGGGSRNAYLKQRLQAQLGEISVLTTDEVGVNSDFKEAIAFAVLAYWRQHGIPGNLPHVTGASQSMPLGEIHFPKNRVIA